MKEVEISLFENITDSNDEDAIDNPNVVDLNVAVLIFLMMKMTLTLK